MSLIALLAWYDEQPRQLATCVYSLGRAGVRHLVAVDGAYALFPDAGRHSAADQHLAIQFACGELGIGLTLHAPPEVWQGNEVEKRSALFALGLSVAREGDWFLVIDADEVVAEAPEDLTERLERATQEVAMVRLRDMAAELADEPEELVFADIVRLFRAQPIHVEGNHYTYKRQDGRVVCGRPEAMEVEALHDTGLQLDHRRGLRPLDRQEAQGVYYDAINATAEERLPCKCGRPGARQVPVRWRHSELGPVADLEDMCERCAMRQAKRNRARLRELGLPADLQFKHRMGKLPEPV